MENTTNYNEEYNHITHKEDDVQFNTVDDILAYYAERHGTKENSAENALS